MKKLYPLLLTVLISATSFGQTTVFQESFETDGNGSRYSTSQTEFSDGAGDFFGRTNLNNTAEDAADLIVGTFYSLSGTNGDFCFAGMDLDAANASGGGGSATQTLEFTGININGFSNLSFAVLLAEDDDGANQDWDPTDNLIIEAQIDGGGYSPILAVESSTGASNSEPAIDTDFNGEGDGAFITSSFQEFSAMLGSGTTLDLRFTLTFDAGDEDIAIDNIRVIDGFTASPNITLGSAVSGLNYVEGSGPSSEGSFSVEGTDLTGDITVTAPTNFEVSLTSGSGFGNSVTLTQSGGSVTSTTVYARLIAGLTANTYNGDVTASSAGATDRTLGLSGQVFAALSCPAVGDLVINEIMRNPNASGADPAGEYFEIYNTTGSAIDMDGWIIRDNDSDTHTIATSLVVPANGYIVIGHQSTAIPTLDYSYGTDMSLANTSDEIVIECSGTVIDEVVYDGSFPSTAGASMELSTNAQNSTDNDSSGNWGEGTLNIGNGDLGSPGAVNSFTLSNNPFEATEFSLYPNPTATGEVTITSRSTLSISVVAYDMLGKRVKDETLVNGILNVSDLKSGIYILRITQGNATTTKKLMIR